VKIKLREVGFIKKKNKEILKSESIFANKLIITNRRREHRNKIMGIIQG